MGYDPTTNAYFRQLLSNGGAQSTSVPSGGGGGGGLIGNKYADTGVAVGGAALYKARKPLINIAKNAWSRDGATPMQDLAESGVAEPLSKSTQSLSTSVPGYGQVNPEGFANAIPASAGEGAAYPGVNTIAPELADGAGAGEGLLGGGLTSIFAPLGAVAGGVPLGSNVADLVTGERGKYAKALANSSTAKGFAQAVDHYGAQTHLSDLSPSQLFASATHSGEFKVAGLSGAAHTASDADHVFGELLKTQGPDAAQQTVDSLKDANAKLDPKSHDYQSTAQRIRSFQSQIQQANTKPANAFAQTVDDQAQNLKSILASNGIDPYGSAAAGFAKDLMQKATQLGKTNASVQDKKNNMEVYGQSVINNVTQQVQAQAYQQQLPQATQTAYSKMSAQLVQPYIQQQQQQAESSAAQLLQLATARAHQGDKAGAFQLMSQASQLRQQATDQGSQLMSLAVGTPRIMAYENQLKAMSSQLATYNKQQGTAGTSFANAAAAAANSGQ